MNYSTSKHKQLILKRCSLVAEFIENKYSGTTPCFHELLDSLERWMDADMLKESIVEKVILLLLNSEVVSSSISEKAENVYFIMQTIKEESVMESLGL